VLCKINRHGNRQPRSGTANPLPMLDWMRRFGKRRDGVVLAEGDSASLENAAEALP